MTTLIYLQIPVPDPPPDEEPIKLSHRERRSARIRAC
ncbi:TPA: hypothetical protein ACVEL4_002393 [Escherichia coli]